MVKSSLFSLTLHSSYGLFILFMVVAANYVLPKSNDMPCSDEFFYQVFSNLVYFMFCLNIYLYFEVMFVELNQGKSQKYLDLMNQNLAYISCNNSST